MSTTKKDDGGLAFPDPLRALPGLQAEPSPGMTLRDWFAGQALCGLYHADQSMLFALCKEGETRNETTSEQTFARVAYEAADAMIAARRKGQP